MGHDGPSKGEGHFGYDGFALTEIPYNRVVEKYVFYQHFLFKIWKKIYALFEQHQKNRLTPGWERRFPTWGKTVPRRFFYPTCSLSKRSGYSSVSRNRMVELREEAGVQIEELDREITVGWTRRKDGGWQTTEESGRVTWAGQEETRETKADMGGLC